MKKIFALFLMLALTLSGSGCSDHSPAANGEAGKLNIYMLNDNQNVRDAIACYAAVAPDVEIEIEVGVPDYDTTVSDALKKLNTRLLSGNGPDIILMDDIQAEHCRGGRKSGFRRGRKFEIQWEGVHHSSFRNTDGKHQQIGCFH